ncbi:MAG: thermonuclease family protein [Elusimicrobiaceae bacterium]|nr:thermonuclease family protein [Elusimicrobiaceae bacterium]
MTYRKKYTPRRTGKKYSKKQIKFWASVIITVILYFMQHYGKPSTQDENSPTPASFENVSIASVYDGDTFKINLNCSLAVYCEKVPVRVLGVDTPEIKGETEREKKLAQQTKAFTQEFLSQAPISLTNCGRDKYFRLLCDVTNGKGQNLAQELIKHNLGYSYYGGTKSDQYK